jgi:UDP-N-acetylmuramoylalanine--D-glutamate ligase
MNWSEKRVVIIGAARQGTALARYLAEKDAQVTLTDARPAEELADIRESLADYPIRWVLGDHPIELLDDADLVCPSGGVPLTIPFVREAIWRGIPLSNDSQIFVQEAPCTIAGITGSAGKTTTTTLLGRIAGQAVEHGFFRKLYVGGNIGVPLINQVDEMAAEDISVVEFSSFQLELMTISPQIAAVLNVTPNHLDRHETMQAYTAAKKNIFAHQGPEDAAVLGFDDPTVWKMAVEVPGRVYAFGTDLPPGQVGAYVTAEEVVVRTDLGEQDVISTDHVELPGSHNLLNVAAACAAAAALGLPADVMRAGIRGFTGVEHRLEFVRQWGGADWYNDSKATSPGMTVTAMQAFNERLIVLVGGRDKHLPWEQFAQQAAAQADVVIAFGEAAGIIQQAVREVLPEREMGLQLEIHPGLDQAVNAAANRVRRGHVVLLAPGGTSFDEFEDYEARGRHFKNLVNRLPVEEQ